MAETMTLRVYLDDVKRLLDRGAATEVISHCRYVLQHYPRNVETYRLLAQALLQKAQDQGSGPLFDEATEVFQRVLGVLPGDHVAHIGLSEIREHEGRLDQAIWHLERAYEQLPGNPMLQEGLRALYAKRDGDSRTPAKIHLTRGALARQYVNGQLYDQALIELRHALEQNPGRLDLQVMLAETLLESHHVVEAGEVALQILKKLPDCLPANRIMARLWLDNERPSDAQVFLDRVEALDPYAAAQVLQPGAHVADPNRIMRLDYGTEVQSTLNRGTPDWVQDLGAVDVGTVFQASPAAAPDFRASEPRQPDSRLPGGEPADDSVSFDWFTAQSESADEMGGDWFAMMGQDEPAETPAASPSLSDAGWLGDRPAEPGSGLPDWFADLGEPTGGASAEPTAQPPVEADWLFGTEEFEIPADLADELPAPEAPAVEPADWMPDLGASEFDLSAAEPEEVPDWLGGAGPVQEELATGADELNWLASDRLPDAPPPAAEAAPVSEPAAEEDWLTQFGSVDSSAFDVFGEQVASEVDWPAEEVAPAPEPAEPASEADWMTEFRALDSDAFSDEEEQGASELAWPAEETASTPEPAGPASEADWIAEFRAVVSDAFDVEEEEQGTSELAWPAEDAAATPEPAESLAEEDWLAEEAEVPPALDEILGEPEVYLSEELAEVDLIEERPPSGFTELLAGIESGPAGTGQDEIVQEEPVVTPPEWLAAVAEDDRTDELEGQETFLSAESAKALLGDDSFLWDDNPEQDMAGAHGSAPAEESGEEALFAQDEAWDMGQDQAETPAEPAAIPDWLTEPENDYFAPPSEQPVEQASLAENALRAELMADSPADWPNEQAMGEEVSAELAELETESPLEAEAEAGWAYEQADVDAGLAEASVPAEDVQEAEPQDLHVWAESDSAPAFEVDQPAAGAALDWLQPQAAEIDWLSSIAKPPADELEPDLFEAEETLAFRVEEEPSAQAFQPESEWLGAEAQADEWTLSGAEAASTFEEEPALPGDETNWMVPRDFHDETASLEDALVADSPAAADDAPAWMADLEPIELDEAPAGTESDLLEKAYDPFEGGSADNVPEYRSAKETGILQPNENPDWMAAFGDDEAPVELEEEPELDVEIEDQESFLAALGIEALDEADRDQIQEAGTNAVADSLADIAAQAGDEALDRADIMDDLAPPPEKASGMPNWLAAITTSAAGQYGEMFDEEESYSSSAEASGVVSERDLDWLQPLGEAEDIPTEEPARGPLDMEAIFGDVEAPVSEETAVPAEEEAFDFDFGEAQVAPADNLAHTKDLEDEAPWLEDDLEDNGESIPDDFSFEEIVPRWLREPKEGHRGASLRQNEVPPTPNWLRDVFDDEESKD